jgi:hypothetical protein
MKIKLPNTDKVHRCPGCHITFEIYYNKSFRYHTRFYQLKSRLLEILPLYCNKCKTLKLPMIWSIAVWKSHRYIKKLNRE